MFELSEPRRQDVRRDSLHLGGQLVVPPGPSEERSDDEKRPSITDLVESEGKRFIGHDPVSQMCLGRCNLSIASY